MKQMVYQAVVLLILLLNGCSPSNPSQVLTPAQSDSPTSPAAIPTILLSATSPIKTTPTNARSVTALLPTLTLTPTVTPTASITATNTPSPTTTPTAPPASLSLANPKWLGCGQIIDAQFLPNLYVAVGWANCISLHKPDGRVVWSQEMPAQTIAIDVHPENRAVAAALADGSVWVFKSESGKGAAYLGASPNAYWGDIAWSPDGLLIAFQFIGPNRGDPIYLLNPLTGAVTVVPNSTIDPGTRPSLVWSPDSKYLSLANLGNTCSQIVDVVTGGTLFSLTPGDSCFSPYTIAWNADGSLLALTGTDDQVHLVIPKTGKDSAVLDSGEVGIAAYPFQLSGKYLFYSPDGKYLAVRGSQGTYGQDNPTIIWNLATRERAGMLPARQEKERLAAAFSGETMVILYEDGELTHWTFGTPTPSTGDDRSGSIQQTVPTYPLTWSPDSRYLATTGRYGGVMVWDVQEAKLLTRIEGNWLPAAISPDGKHIALINLETTGLVTFGLKKNNQVLSLVNANPRSLAAYSPDGADLVYGSENQVRIIDSSAGTPLATLEGGAAGESVMRFKWSADGKVLVSISGIPGNESAGTIILWKRLDRTSFKEVLRSRSTRWNYPQEPLVLFNPSGSLAAVESLPISEASSAELIIFDLASETVLSTLKEYLLGSWLGDGTLLASEAQYDTRLISWDVGSGRKTTGVGRQTGGTIFSPGGWFTADTSSSPLYAGRGVVIHRWDTGAQVVEILLGSDVIQIAWSPDGHWLALLGVDGTIKVWQSSIP